MGRSAWSRTIAAGAGIILGACGLGGGGGGGMTTPPAIDPSGQWEETVETTRNTCGAAWGDPSGSSKTIDILLTLSPDKTGLQIEEEGQPCDPNRVLPYGGNTILADGATEFFVAADGCQYKASSSGFIGTFTSGSSFSSQPFTTTYSLDMGTNCSAFDALPCQVTTVTTADRCDACYDGCTVATSLGTETASPRGLRPPM